MTIAKNILCGTAEAISKDDPNYQKVLNDMYAKLVEESFSYLSATGGTDKGFPFAYTNESGSFSLGIVFAADLKAANEQLSQFTQVFKSRAFDSETDGHQINGFMTKEMMHSKLRQGAVELPLINYFD